MPTSTLHQFERLLEHLSPQDLLVAQERLSERRKHSQALCLIDDTDKPSCPNCGAHKAQKWGRSRVGLQRFRCVCGRTYTKRSDTPLSAVKHLPKFLTLLQDMTAMRNISCRSAAERLGVGRMTVWRWRMSLLKALNAPGAKVFEGIVEIDETYQRESRKASREWIHYQNDPLAHKRPPRSRWSDMRPGTRPRGRGRWYLPLLGITSRGAGVDLLPMPSGSAQTIGQLAGGRISQDCVLYTDGGLAVETFATRGGYAHTACVKGYKRKTREAHLNTVNGLHSLWSRFIGRFCGPASRHLALYVKWFVLTRNRLQTAQEIFQGMIRA